MGQCVVSGLYLSFGLPALNNSSLVSKIGSESSFHVRRGLGVSCQKLPIQAVWRFVLDDKEFKINLSTRERAHIRKVYA